MHEEEIRNIVIKGYKDILKREPDQDGLANYIHAIKYGLTIERFHDILRSSNEYKEKFENFENLGIIKESIKKSYNVDENDIRNVVIDGYRYILMREPDLDGLENYVHAIKHGLTIESFCDSLRFSDEHRRRFDLNKFDKLIYNNKSSGLPWYYGLEGTWWFGMTEEQIRYAYKGEVEVTYSHPNAIMAVPHIRPKIIGQESSQSHYKVQEYDDKIQGQVDKIILVSTWKIKCGIAIYTEDLYNEFNKIYPNLFMVNPFNDGVLQYNIKGKLSHLQHEFGIMKDPPPIEGKVIMTWHTIPYNIADTIKRFESQLDIVAHIIPTDAARKYMRTSKDVYTINLGSKLMPSIRKEDARALLNIEHIDMPIGFVFGFQSVSKNYDRLIRAAKNTGIHLIISGSIHQCGYDANISNGENITVIGRYLSDSEIDLYSIASDMLLYDYIEQGHYSSSSALHRTVGSGRPVICANTMHFSDIDGVPKFNSQDELERCIIYALGNQDSLERLSLQYAQDTSRENMAKKHIDVYRKYVDI